MRDKLSAALESGLEIGDESEEDPRLWESDWEIAEIIFVIENCLICNKSERFQD